MVACCSSVLSLKLTGNAESFSRTTGLFWRGSAGESVIDLCQGIFRIPSNPQQLVTTTITLSFTEAYLYLLPGLFLNCCPWFFCIWTPLQISWNVLCEKKPNKHNGKEGFTAVCVYTVYIVFGDQTWKQLKGEAKMTMMSSSGCLQYNKKYKNNNNKKKIKNFIQTHNC